MGYVFETSDLGKNYEELYETLRNSGEPVSPRGTLVYEMRPLIVSLTNPRRSLVGRRGISKALMTAEIVSMLAHRFSDRLMDAVTNENNRSLFTRFGAYGPRTASQMAWAINELHHDPDTRRSIVHVGQPRDLEYVRNGISNDMPCTESYQFLIRNGLLEVHVKMRSWDIVWGLTYDIPNAASIQSAVAWSLRLPEGPLTVIASSGHLYDRHTSGLEFFHRDEELTPITGVNYEAPLDRYQSIVSTAREAIRAFEHDEDPPEDWADPVKWWRRAEAR